MCFGGDNNEPPSPPPMRPQIAPKKAPVIPKLAAPPKLPPPPAPVKRAPLPPPPKVTQIVAPPKPAALAPPPTPQEILDVIDEITGTKTVTGKDPVTGKKVRLIQKLPRSRQEEALYVQAGQLMAKTIGEIQRLDAYDPSQVVKYAPFVNVLNTLNTERAADMQRLTQIPDFTRYVDDFKGMQREIIDEQYNRSYNEEMATLGHRGYGRDSTAISETTALLKNNRDKALRQAEIESVGYGRQLRRDDIADRYGEYGMRESERQGRFNSASTEYSLQQQYAQNLENQRQAALQHQGNLYNVASGIRGAETNKQMATMAPNLALAEFGAHNQNALNFNNAYNANALSFNNAEVNNALNQYSTATAGSRNQYEMELARNNFHLGHFQAHAGAELGHNNYELAHHNSQLNAYNAQPPSFGQQVLGLGSSLGSAYFLGGGGRGFGATVGNLVGGR